MRNYLIVYSIHYKKKTIADSVFEEIKEELEKIGSIKDRELLESIYRMAKNIWYKSLSENLIIKTDFKWEMLFNFIIECIQEKWVCNEEQYLETSIENIINLD